MPDRLSDAQRRLAAAQARAKRRKLGKPLKTTDADLDALSAVGPQDVGEIEAFIRSAAGQAGVDLFNAGDDPDA